MTSPEIRVKPAEAMGALGGFSNQFGDHGSGLARAGGALDPSAEGNLDQHRQDTQRSVTDAGGTTDKGKQAATAHGEQDQRNGSKAGAVDPNLKDAAGLKKGEGGSGVGRDGPRLSASDLAKLTGGAGQYQSPMPSSQTAPSMPQIPQIPTSGLSAPTQSMMGAPGAISPLLDQILQRAAQNPSGDGGPASHPMGSALEGKGGQLQDLVRKNLGTPYAWGGGALNGPSKGISDGGGPADRAGDYNKIGYDCSGWSRYVTYQMTGHEIPRTSEAQFAAGAPISASQAQPGDLYFPSSAGRPPGHVQVYIGNNQVAEAPSSGQTLKISALQPGEFRRMVSA